MDDTQLLRGVTEGDRALNDPSPSGQWTHADPGRPAPKDCYTTGYDPKGSDAFNKALRKIELAMSREGSKPSGADSTGETGADVCEARTPWRGQPSGVRRGKP